MGHRKRNRSDVSRSILAWAEAVRPPPPCVTPERPPPRPLPRPLSGGGGGAEARPTGVAVVARAGTWHDPPGELERPARVGVTISHLRELDLLRACVSLPVCPATRGELEAVHDGDHIDRVERWGLAAAVDPRGVCRPAADVAVAPDTPMAARVAVGAVIAAARAVARGEVRNAMALVRPPGHHAGVATARGFCLFNNVAVGVRAAQRTLREEGGVDNPRVLVVDWDVHHGDGTEEIFRGDESVRVVSVHQFGDLPYHPIRREKKARTEDREASRLQDDEEVVSALVDILGNDADSAPHIPDSANTSSMELRKRPAIDFKALNAALLSEDDATDDDGVVVPMEDKSASGESSSTSVSDEDEESDGDGRDVVQPQPFDDGASDVTAIEAIAADHILYPGTGPISTDAGILNIPWPSSRMSDMEYMTVWEELVVPFGVAFAPHLIVISAGFDSAAGDTLGDMMLSPSAFYVMTQTLSRAVCPAIVVALEGGYDVPTVARCTEMTLRALINESSSELSQRARARDRSAMERCRALIERVKAAHPVFNVPKSNSPRHVGDVKLLGGELSIEQ